MSNNIKISESIKILVRSEFVEGYLDENEVRQFPSYGQLAKRHDLHQNTIGSWARKDKWQQLRDDFQQNLSDQTKKVKVASFAEVSRLHDERCLAAANGIIETVGRGLQELQEEETLNTTKLRDLANALISAQKAGKLALGEAQEIQKVTADAGIPNSFVQLCGILERVGGRKAEDGNHVIN